jgi:fatty-acyl-CoA synthase/long-chain acyl-CoA synthetase
MTEVDEWPKILGSTWWAALCEAAGRYEDDKAAFEFEGVNWARTLSFGEWREAAAVVSTAFARLGVTVGDRIAALGLGSPLWPVLQAACSRVGAILVPINYRYRHDELVHVMRLARPTVTVTAERVHETATLQELRRAAADAGVSTRFIAVAAPDIPLETTVEAPTAPGSMDVLDWEQLLALGAGLAGADEASDPSAGVLLQFTSGTTAFPKAALLANGPTLGTALQLGRRMGLTPDDRFYSTQPFYHVGGSVATTLMPLTIGCTTVVAERYTVEETFRIIAKHRCTARTGQAAMYWMELAHADFAATTFSTVTKGWAGGTPELRRMIIDRMGIEDLTTVYGMTEACATTTVPSYDAPLNVRVETCGPPLPGLEVAIAGDDGERVTTPGALGEICIRGWSLMLGYFADPEATAAAIDADGWLHSGDLGSFDADGNLTVVDRLKDMIKPGGENVSPAEVERVIQGLDDIVQVSVVGMPDERLGEVPVAFVELRPGSTLKTQSIIDRCKEEMASFKVPRLVIFVTEWPLTESGKIQKHALRERVAGRGRSVIGGTG